MSNHTNADYLHYLAAVLAAAVPMWRLAGTDVLCVQLQVNTVCVSIYLLHLSPTVRQQYPAHRLLHQLRVHACVCVFYRVPSGQTNIQGGRAAVATHLPGANMHTPQHHNSAGRYPTLDAAAAPASSCCAGPNPPRDPHPVAWGQCCRRHAACCCHLRAPA